MLDPRWRVLTLVLLTLAAAERRTAASDPPVVHQDAKLFASDMEWGDAFGSDLALSGDTLLVGSYNWGPGTDYSVGKVHVYLRAGGRWTEQAILFSPDPALGDQFGLSVAIDGDTAVIGAPGDDADFTNTGAAYVFVRSGGAWSLEQKLVTPDPGLIDYFGGSVSISGDTVLVSDELDDNAGGVDAGSAHVFVRSGGEWTHQAQLFADDGGPGDQFGIAVALSGDTAVASAPLYDQVGGHDEGAVYVFVRSGSSWTQQARLLATGAALNDALGDDIAVEANTLVVGATACNPLGFGDAGAAYVFARSGGLWSQQAKLLDPAPDFFDHFGSAVALSGGAILVGTPDDDEGTMASAGTSFLFTRSGTTWSEAAELAASDPRPLDRLGSGVALSADVALAGAPSADTPSIDNVGATYGFDVAELTDAWVELGFGLAGAGGVPSLVGSGTLAAASPGALALSGANPSSPAMLFVAFASTPTPFKGGTLVPVPAALSLPLATNGAGALTLAWAAWPAGLPAGTALYFQYAIADAGGPFGAALSNALCGTTP